MKTRTLLFSGLMLFAPTFVYGACSVANLTRCLDSVCAINIGANPAARCQYCGSKSAGEPTKSTAMKSITAGASAKYTISDKELKKAPSDPGERYVWGTKLCLEKVSGCTADDVTDNYDSLIEQSCTAAGISAEMASLSKKVNTVKTQSACTTEISACVIEEKRCNADYKNCESDSDFDKYLSECGVMSNGCDEFLSNIRKTLTDTRKTMYATANQIVQKIIAAYQSARKQKLTNAQNACKNNKAKTDCINRVCQNNMSGKCATLKTVKDGEKVEWNAAEELCKFYDTACAKLK